MESNKTLAKLVWLAWKDNHPDKKRMNFREMWWRDFYFEFYMKNEKEFNDNGIKISLFDKL